MVKIKKKDKISAKQVVVTNEDLKSIIKDNSEFFDKLVELIPPKFFIPAPEKTTYFQGLSRVAKASAKKESRENRKKARKAKLDPEVPSGTLDVLKQKLLEDSDDDSEDDDEEEEEEEEDDDDNERKLQIKELRDEEKSLTYEELQGKLNRKLEELRSGRKAGPEEESNREKKRQSWFLKRKRENEGQIETKAEIKKKAEANIQSKKIKEDIAKAVDGLTFGHVKIDENDGEFGKKKRKLSKSQALQEARKIQEAKKDPEKGEIIAKKHTLSAAISRAAGIKVHDDPKLINKSIKKERKQQQKSAQKWKDRDETKNKARAEKQKARNDNIQGRIQAKKAKKIEKREKKLMRPGFEGRTQKIINEPAKN
ncbi:hypothetical protein C5167_012947 [Papaver somniferum]|uniref:Ribosomal RNA-processing protein 14/surfeit locus protein 6 C-terminal domain-containing protein n=1 Tax=Papaver somniferum TaxID=3469 RepID=A0A4Y7J0W5_PAPSO|nr:ribosomal RNA-processing protein 14-like [Papaver somniferum]RZC54086.1 hypothetical protein C5167_012947 [Papaver somniferum]